jgi:hypothetical protein
MSNHGKSGDEAEGFMIFFIDLIESNRGQCNVIKLLGDYRTYIIINLVQEKIKKG